MNKNNLGAIIILLIISSCNYTKDEKSYLTKLKIKYPRYEFGLPDRLTGLELRVHLDTNFPDTLKMETLLMDARELAKDYEIINWPYLTLYFGDEFLWSIYGASENRIIHSKSLPAD